MQTSPMFLKIHDCRLNIIATALGSGRSRLRFN